MSNDSTIATALATLTRLNDKAAVLEMLELLTAVFANISSDAGNSKLLKFNATGGVFKQKIAPLQHSAELLEALGYRRHVTNKNNKQRVWLKLPRTLATPSTMERYLQLLIDCASQLRARDAKRAPERLVIGDERNNNDDDGDDDDDQMDERKERKVDDDDDDDNDDKKKKNKNNNNNNSSNNNYKYANQLALMIGLGCTEKQSRELLVKFKGDVTRACNAAFSDNAPPKAAPAPLVRTESAERRDREEVLKLAQQLEEREEQARREAEAASLALINEMKEADERQARAAKDRNVAIAMEDELAALRLMRTESFGGAKLPLDVYNIRNLGDRFDPSKVATTVYKCAVCMDDELKLNEIVVLSCRHHLCCGCMNRYIRAELDAGKARVLKCFDPKCKWRLQVSEVQMGADRQTVERYQELMLNAHLSSDPDVRWCPKKKCGTAMIGSKHHPMLQCPACKYRFCFNCKTSEWHEGSTCQQYQEWKKLNANAESSFEKWRKSHTKVCPKCKVSIEKNGGCDHMTCRNCHYEFYWSTGKKYR